jgi:SAM-dependent methyltransferase
MDPQLENETQSLSRQWSQHAAEDLRDYMIADVEDPRLNVQSIFSRHLLIRAVAGARFEELCEHEIRFACLMNWLLQRIKQGASADWFDGVLGETLMADDAALGETGEESAPEDDAGAGPDGDQPIDGEPGEPVPPRFLRDLAGRLPVCDERGQVVVPDYLFDALSLSDAELMEMTVPERVLGLFERVWAEQLQTLEPTAPPAVLEPACASASDYRFLERFGIARLIDYQGFDICPTNIQNAQGMFPEAAARFSVGNVFGIDAADDAYACVFTHDLLEHLSQAGIDAAIAELCRVTRGTLMVHFFNLEDRAEHVIQPIEHYHWNLLSLSRVREQFEAHGGRVEATHVPTHLSNRFDFHESHNDEAWTLMVRFG